MTNLKDLQFFLKSPRSEKEILEVASEIFGFLVESINFKNDKAPGYAIINLYSDGFGQGIMVSWLSPTELSSSIDEIAKKLSMKLNDFVLVEHPYEEDGWILGNPGGSVSRVEVIDLPDGIDIK